MSSILNKLIPAIVGGIMGGMGIGYFINESPYCPNWLKKSLSKNQPEQSPLPNSQLKLNELKDKHTK